jgi:hypothetical protein
LIRTSDAFALKSDQYSGLGICSSGSRRGYVKAQEVGGKLVSGIRAPNATAKRDLIC